MRNRVPFSPASAAIAANLLLGVAELAGADCSPLGDSSTINFYVSTNGVDSPGGGSLSMPWRTLHYARDQVRTVDQCPNEECYDICVYLRGGTYPFSTPLEFGPVDSGRSGRRVVYRSYGSERPSLSGGTTITGWVLNPRTDFYEAPVNVAAVGPFRQIYDNGVRGTRARKPNIGELTSGPEEYMRGSYRVDHWDPPRVTPLKDGTCPTSPTAAKALFAPTSQATGIGPYDDTNGNRPEVAINMSWARNLLRIGQIVAVGGGLSEIQPGPGRSPECADCPAALNPFFERDILFGPDYCYPERYDGMTFHFENVESFLDERGEWYLRYSNDGIANDTAIYYPRRAQGPGTMVVPTLSTLVRFVGASDTVRVHSIEFQGVTFEYTAWNDPHNMGFIDGQSTVHLVPPVTNPAYPWGRLPAAVYLRNASAIRLVQNTLRHLGGVGIDIHASASGNEIAGNIISDVSGSAVAIGPVRPGPGQPDYLHFPPDNNVISHNFIRDIGVDYGGGNAVFLTRATNTSIENNDIAETRWTGISLGYGHQFSPPLAGQTVTNNRIHHVLDTLVDGGGIYNAGRWTAAQPSRLDANYVHDLVRSRASLPVPPNPCPSFLYFPIAAIYLDGGDPMHPMETYAEVTDNALVNAYSCTGDNSPLLIKPYVTHYVQSGNDFAYGSVKTGSGPGAPYRSALPGRTPGSFITGMGLTSRRNDHTGHIGYWIKVGPRPMIVRQLGRLHVPGNVGQHWLRIVRKIDDLVVAEARVDMTRGSADALGYKYVSLTPPVTLAASTEYRIVSEEVSGGDYFYDYDGTVRTEGDAIVQGNSHSIGTNWYHGTVVGRGHPMVNLVTDGRKLIPRVVEEGDPMENKIWTSEQGMKVDVGVRDLAVSKLGRYFAEGPQGSHTLKVYRKDLSATPLVASATVAMSGPFASPDADDEGFKYAPVTDNLRLSRNRSYYLASVEPPSDLWFDYDTQVVSASEVAVSPAYFDGLSWHDVALPDHGYGPVSAVYEPLSRLLPCTGAGTCTTIGTLRSDGGRSGMRVTVPFGKTLTLSEIGRYQHAGNSGSRMLGVYSSGGTQLASATLTLGPANPLDDDGFKYAALSAPLVLAAGEYYVASDEVVGQAYADYNTLVFPNSDVTEVVPAYFNGVDWTPVSGSPGHAYGPLNLIYYSKP